MVAGGLVVLAGLVGLAVSVRRARATERRLGAVATRLDVPGAAEGVAPEDTLTRLERLAESAVLRVSEAEAGALRMAGALGELPQGVAVCDEVGTVVYRNEAAVALTELAPEDPEVDEAVADVVAAGLQGQRQSSSVELLGPPQRTLTVSGRPLDDGRRTIGAVAVVDDVSERRRLDLLRQDFVDNVTAELKTPLGGLALLASALAEEQEPALALRLARRLRDDALQVGRVIDDLAELSRVVAEILPQRELVPVHVVVTQAVREAGSGPAKGSVVVDVVDVPRRLTVEGHRRQLVSAVRRLVENALSASPEGTAVRVAVTRRGRWAEIAVSDQGPGIPGSELDRIFESFYRLDGEGRAGTRGAGLGLAIASQVAGAHGGEILVTSREGVGSTFMLRLPLGSRARHRHAAQRLARPRWESAVEEAEPQPRASAPAG